MKAPPLYAAVFVAISPTILPSAPKDHVTYAAYSTLGAQFVTPGSYRCRLSYISNAATSLRHCTVTTAQHAG